MRALLLNKVIQQYVHIDNGGITMSITDKGRDQGIWFDLATEYFGYPGLHASMRIDVHYEAFFDKMEAMIKEARREFKKIDWDNRYNTFIKENSK